MQRLWKAFFYSLAGLRAAWQSETAFRQEVVVSAVMVPLALLLPVALALKAILVASHFLLLVTELLNSAIEAVVDLASPQQHPLAKNAKDWGSAAVLLCLVELGVVWLLALIAAYRG